MPTEKPQGIRAQKKAERPGEILRAAFAEFVDKGFIAGRVEDIAKRIGVTKGTVYFYFETKERLFEEVMVSVSAAIASDIASIPLDTRGTYVELGDREQRFLSDVCTAHPTPSTMAEVDIANRGLESKLWRGRISTSCGVPWPAAPVRPAAGAARGPGQPAAQCGQLHRPRPGAGGGRGRDGGGERHRHRHVRRRAGTRLRAVLPGRPAAGAGPGPAHRAPPVRPLRLDRAAGQQRGRRDHGHGALPGRPSPRTDPVRPPAPGVSTRARPMRYIGQLSFPVPIA